MLARPLILAIAVGLIASACSKTEPPPPAKPTTPKSSGTAPAAPPERLAHQEAAAKMSESKVLQPTPPRAPEPPAAAKSPEPAKAQAPKPAPGAKPQSARASPSPAPPPRTDLAAARPSAAAPEPEAATRLVTRVDPDFPREATAAGVEEGLVKARMTLDAAGSVTRVEVLEAKPRRVFDRAVVRALSQWRYNDGAAGRTVDMEIAFRR